MKYSKRIWVLMIDGAGKEIHFKSEDLDTAGEWCSKYIDNNYIYSERPNWRCTSAEIFRKYKWTYGALDGKWYKATDFTKGIIDTSKVSFKSNKQFKNK